MIATFCQDTESGREVNPGRWIGNPRFNQWAIEDPNAESKVKSLFYFLPVKTEFQKMQRVLEQQKLEHKM